MNNGGRCSCAHMGLGVFQCVKPPVTFPPPPDVHAGALRVCVAAAALGKRLGRDLNGSELELFKDL